MATSQLLASRRPQTTRWHAPGHHRAHHQARRQHRVADFTCGLAKQGQCKVVDDASMRGKSASLHLLVAEEENALLANQRLENLGRLLAKPSDQR